MLQVEGYNATGVGRGDEAIEMAARSRFDIVLVDLYMTPVPGMEILKAILAARPNTIVIMMTGNASVESSVDALEAGAWDYLPKPFAATHLQVLVGRAAYAVIALRERDAQRRQPCRSPRAAACSCSAIRPPSAAPSTWPARSPRPTPRSCSLARAAPARSLSPSSSTPTAAAPIARSFRSTAPRCPSTCSSPRCSATARARSPAPSATRSGLFEAAHGGTFFLDELTEMPLPLQAKLLRVVQDGVVRRVGSEQQDAVVDVRFISATNRDPREAIHSKHLREDLYYRLNVVPITLPPLRERVDDIPILANFFLAKFWQRHHSPRAGCRGSARRRWSFSRPAPGAATCASCRT